MASKGITVIASSGDDGVMGSGINGQSCSAACTTSSGSASTAWPYKSSNTWTGNGYFPDFPATDPYVTAVGATMGSTNVVPNTGEAEQACQVSLFSYICISYILLLPPICVESTGRRYHFGRWLLHLLRSALFADISRDQLFCILEHESSAWLQQ